MTSSSPNMKAILATLTPSKGLSFQWPERRKKLRKHRLRTTATIEAIFKLFDVAAKVLGADAGVRAVDRTFQVAPEILNPVDGHRLGKAIIVIGIFFRAVVHAGMAITGFRKARIAT